jgi:hypothetical protein
MTASGIARFSLFFLLACNFIMQSGRCATLSVGHNQLYKLPSDAAAVARDGDRVEIEPGEYFDCAVWRANNLLIEGTAPGVVITDKTCIGKGIFIVAGNNTTVRNLTLTRARVADMNGAGIRLDGGDLLVDGVRFIDNQDGILGGGLVPDTSVIIINSYFEKNGYCGEGGGGCAHAIYVNNVNLLRVTKSTFINTQMGHSIKSRALRTEITGCDISDGPEGTSSFLIDVPNGGTLIVRDSTLEKGPKSQNHNAAIEIGVEGVTHPTPEILIFNNTLHNDGDYQTTLLMNATATPALLKGNQLLGRVTALKGDGRVE